MYIYIYIYICMYVYKKCLKLISSQFHKWATKTKQHVNKALEQILTVFFFFLLCLLSFENRPYSSKISTLDMNRTPERIKI